MTRKVMIIDDSETNLKMMDMVFTKAGFKTDTVINPKYAIDVIREAKPNIILLDINMPEVNGFQICKAMQKDPELAEIPVIFVSALSNVEYIAGGLAMGAVDYVTKPIKVDEIVARVNIQLKLAYTRKKLKRTNEALQNELNENKIELSDMQSDLTYSLIKLKSGDENPKHYERIRDFCKFSINKAIEESPYMDDLDKSFINEVIKKAMQ